MICMVFLILVVYAIGFTRPFDTLDGSLRNFILFTKFGNLTGKPIEGQVINRAFNKLIEEKGLPKVVFHRFRISYSDPQTL